MFFARVPAHADEHGGDCHDIVVSVFTNPLSDQIPQSRLTRVLTTATIRRPVVLGQSGSSSSNSMQDVL